MARTGNCGESLAHQPEHQHRRTRRALHLGLKAQVVCVITAFLVSAWLTISTVSYVGSRNLLTERAKYIGALEQAYAELLSQSKLSRAAYANEVEELEQAVDRHHLKFEDLARSQTALQRQVDWRDRQIVTLTRQRDEAQARAEELAKASAELDQQLARAKDEKLFLNEELETVEARLAAVSQQRDAGRRVENGLRWQIARLESRLGDLEENRETEHVWFKDYVVSSVEALEHLFDGTGVDLETLVARAAGDESDEEATSFQGGPFEGIEVEVGQSVGLPAARAGAGYAIPDHFRRLSALQKLASALPLASPLDHFHVTSTYGKRNDPLTRKLAFHGGLDLGAAPGSQAMATAPGRVTFAGPLGPYGNMVEIDHGMGVVTRYGHLKEILVDAGTDVEFRHPVGVIGSTGRSTGRHLHYEVRVDDEPHNPAKFLEAGRYLVDIFNFKPVSSAESPPQG